MASRRAVAATVIAIGGIVGGASSGGGLGLLGCATKPAQAVSTGDSQPVFEFTADLLPTASEQRANADWNDISASVGYAVGMVQMAVVSQNGSNEHPRVFLIRTVGDEPVRLEVARAEGADAAASNLPIDMTLRCTVGRFGDAAREQVLLKEVVARLRRLRAVDSAPLPD